MKKINFSTTKILLVSTVNIVNNFFNKIKLTSTMCNFWDQILLKTNFINVYYIRNENIWSDGFLFDFLQKKTADAWVRRFVIYTGFLFSERIVFEFIVRIYLDNMIWVFHNKSLFELSNTSEMLTTTLFILLSLIFFILTSLVYIIN